MDFETEQEVLEEDSQLHYAIDMDWYREKGRSFMSLATRRLCPSSQKRVPKTESTLFKTFKQCCSKSEHYVEPTMPLLEIIYRIFLANNNQPQSLKQLNEKLLRFSNSSNDNRDISIAKLKQIISNDRYYGLRAVDVIDGCEDEPNTVSQND
jgi:hypothetical protein